MTTKTFFQSPARVMLSLIAITLVAVFSGLTIATLVYSPIFAIFYVHVLAFIVVLVLPFYPAKYNKWGTDNLKNGFSFAFKSLWKLFVLGDNEHFDKWFQENYPR